MTVSKKVKRKEEFAFINHDNDQFYHSKRDINCCDRKLENILSIVKKADTKRGLF